MKYHFLYGLLGLMMVLGCIPSTKREISEVTLDVDDPIYQQVMDLQDRQRIDSLLSFTSHENPSYRYLVANAFASIQDKKGLDSLYKLLRDPVMKVRTAAAYSIGQINTPQGIDSLLNAFKQKDTLEVDNEFNMTILEAIGKIGGRNLLTPLATVSTYRTTDSLLLYGQARAIYQYALRNMTTTEGTDRMIYFLTEQGVPDNVRMIAANYLARAKDIDILTSKFQLASAFENSKNPSVKMALATALGKTKDLEMLPILQNAYVGETDYGVKTNIVRSLNNFPYINVIDPILELLDDENLELANLAANYLITNGNRNDALIYKDFIKPEQHYSVKAKIYSAILNHLPIYFNNTRSVLLNEVKSLREAAKTPYERVAYLEVMSYDPGSYVDVINLMNESKTPVVKSACASAIHNILKNPTFIQKFRDNHRNVKRQIIESLKVEINGGDSGVLAVLGEMFADDRLDLKPLVEDVEFLESAMRKLSLPREIESYNSLGKAVAYLSDTIFNPKTPVFNNPIDWNILKTYGDSTEVAIKTTKGVIRVKMLTYEAPATVSNFLKLARDGFFNGKNFHRVVTNFVIQGGCPRGDGYGSLDYTIRSELSQMYYDDEGYIGMASAGLHTEGTQFFITHSPSPHLDGKYTIFGKVISGMEIVKSIFVGDEILEVIVIKN